METYIENLENEIWKPVVGYEGCYEISNHGRFKRLAGYKLNSWKQKVTREESYPIPSTKTSDTIYLYKEGDTEKQTKKGYKIDELLMMHFSLQDIKYDINPVIDQLGEEWMSIIGYPDYEISNKGRVKALSKTVTSRHGTRTTREKLVSQYHNKLIGYIYVNLHAHGMPTSKSLHRLLAQTWIPNPENKREVNHKDGNKLNNKIENLEWMTPGENSRHAILNGAKKMVLNMEKVKEIRDLKDMGLHNSQIALVTGIKRTYIHKIVKRELWNY